MRLTNLAVPLAMLMLNSTLGNPHDLTAVSTSDSSLALFEQAKLSFAIGDATPSWRENWEFELANDNLGSAQLKNLLNQKELMSVQRLLRKLKILAMRLECLVQTGSQIIYNEVGSSKDGICADHKWEHNPKQYLTELHTLEQTAGYVRALIFSFRVEFELCLDKDASQEKEHENLLQLRNHFDLTLYLLNLIDTEFVKIRSSGCFEFEPLTGIATEVATSATEARSSLIQAYAVFLQASDRLGLRWGDTLHDYFQSWQELKEKKMRDKQMDEEVLKLATSRYLKADEKNQFNRWSHPAVSNSASGTENIVNTLGKGIKEFFQKQRETAGDMLS